MNLKESYFSGVEDDKRVFENDKKCDKNGNPMKPFVPIEEVPDGSVDIEEETDEKIKRIKEEIENEPEEEIETPERKEDVEIGFTEEDGVAHIGPDFYKEKVENSIDAEVLEKSPTSELLKKNYKFKGVDEFKNSVQPTHWPAVGHDNLKTLKKKKSFLEKFFRRKTREVLDNPEFEEPVVNEPLEIMSEHFKEEEVFEKE